MTGHQKYLNMPSAEIIISSSKTNWKSLFATVNEKTDVQGRYFVDSAPVLERDWAQTSGLGWIGKNTLLIHPKMGSYFFLAELILDVELVYDHPIEDHCGTCTSCIDACPTRAIAEDGYEVDGSQCISYLTIELKNEIPVSFAGQMDQWAFGCDVCQDVCPWNRFSQPHDEPEFRPDSDLLHLTKEEWCELSEDKIQSFIQTFRCEKN